MPEGHMLHRIARDHTNWFANEKMTVTSPQGRFTREARQLSGKKLITADAYGKHLIYRFAGMKILHVHLGLYGKFRVHKNPPPDPRGAVRVRMVGGERAFDLNGPNCCELLSEQELCRLLDRIGPDPLRKDADADACWQKINRSKAAIGTLLLDQTVIAGIGNIYRSEILFRLEIHPDRRGCDVSRDEFEQIWETSVELMQIGVKYNRIITKRRDEVDVPLGRLSAGERLMIYKQPFCGQCDSGIDDWELGGRKVFACPRCQS